MKTNTRIAKILFFMAIIFAALLIRNNVSLAAETSSLNINMTVNDEKYDVSTVGYEFEIELKDAENNPVTGTFNCTGCNEESITLTEGKASVTVTGALANISIEGLTSGWKYTVVPGCADASRDYYIPNEKEFSGILNTGANNIQVNCEVYTYDMNITAYFSGIPENYEEYWNILIHQYSDIPNPREALKYEGAKSGEYIMGETLHIGLKNNDTITIKDVPIAITGPRDNPNPQYNYKANHTDILIDIDRNMMSEHHGIYDSNGTAISSSGPFDSSLILVTYREPVKPMIQKYFGGQYGGETDREFSVKVKAEFVVDEEVIAPISGNYPYKVYFGGLTDEYIVREGIAQFDENGETILKIKANEQIVIGGEDLIFGLNGEPLHYENGQTYDENGERKPVFRQEFKDRTFPTGTRISVEEIGAEGYKSTVNGNGIFFAIINQRLFNGNLVLTKTVEGEEADLDREFKFTIKFYPTNDDLGQIEFYQRLVFYDDGTEKKALELDENYEAEVTLKHGEKITISSALGGLPVGIKYQITEEDYSEEGYVATAENAEGAIKEGENLVEFTNTKKVEESEEAEEEPVEEIDETPQTGDIIIKVCTALVISLILLNGLATIIVRRNK